MALKNKPGEQGQAARWALATMPWAATQIMGRKKGNNGVVSISFFAEPAQPKLRKWHLLWQTESRQDLSGSAALHGFRCTRFTTDCKHRHMRGESQHGALLHLPGSLPEHICMKCLSREDLDSHRVPLLPFPICAFSRHWAAPTPQISDGFFIPELHFHWHAQPWLHWTSTVESKNPFKKSHFVPAASPEPTSLVLALPNPVKAAAAREGN